MRSARTAQPGPARPWPAQRAWPTAWPSSARRLCARGAAARHACSAAVTSPAHERRCGEGHGWASPACGRWRGASSRYRRRRADGTTVRVRHDGVAKATAPRLTSGVGDGSVRTVRRGRRRGHTRSAVIGA
jgi:hypothetical protein